MAAIRMTFDIEKEYVDDDLGVFAGDILSTLESTPESNELRVGLEDLLVEAQQCATMPASEFWVKCEGIVQKLDDKRQELPMGGLKQAHTRLLFILTRCTRLLQFCKKSVFVEKHILGSDLDAYKELAVEISRQPDLLTEKQIQKINDQKETRAGKQDNLDEDSSSRGHGVEVNTGSVSSNFPMSVAEKNLTVNNTLKAKEKSNIQPNVLFPLWRSLAIGHMEEIIRTRFDKEKEHVDADLGMFAGNLLTTLESTPESNKELRVGLENLLLEARQCATMPASEYWVKCEGVVQKLDDKRHELPMGGLKQAHNRLLFILIRCSRLVQFHKESGFVENHLRGIRQLSELGVYKERVREISQPDLLGEKSR